MPNGGIHHCGNCRYFQQENNYCRLRQLLITDVHRTTCRSFNLMHKVPEGPVYAIICEVFNSAGSYCDIPYYLGNRPECIQDPPGSDTCIRVSDNSGKVHEFSSSDEYVDFYDKLLESSYILTGAIAGDIIGSRFEFHNHRSVEFDLFNERSHYTDDTVLTLAVADAIITGKEYVDSIVSIGRRYPKSGYGVNFGKWLTSVDHRPYNSFGNGSAMRVSAVAWAFNDLETVMKEAERSAAVTHNHPEGIKGAVSVASAIFMARNGESKEEIRQFIATRFGYNLSRSIESIRPSYNFDETCQGSVPEAITAFLESTDFESAIRLAVSIGGDSDTIASIAGAIAEAFYNDVPGEIRENAIRLLPDDLLKTLIAFSNHSYSKKNE